MLDVWTHLIPHHSGWSIQFYILYGNGKYYILGYKTQYS